MTSPETGDAKVAPQGDDGHARRQLWRGLGFGTLAAVFGLITGVVSFIFLVDPALRPDPREIQSATLQTVAIDRGVMFRDYLARLGKGKSPEANELRACEIGTVVYLQANLQGFKSRHAVVQYFTYDAKARTRWPVTQEKNLVVSGGSNLRFTGEVSSDQSISPLWVQWPPKNGSYFLRFEIFHGNNLLAVEDTKPFPVDGNDPSLSSSKSDCSGEVSSGQPPQPELQSFPEGNVGGGGGIDWTGVFTYIALGSAAALAIVGAASFAVRFRRRR